MTILAIPRKRLKSFLKKLANLQASSEAVEQLKRECPEFLPDFPTDSRPANANGCQENRTVWDGPPPNRRSDPFRLLGCDASALKSNSPNSWGTRKRFLCSCYCY